MAERPTRHKRSRTPGSKLPPGVVCVTRGTKWGNPHIVGAFGVDGMPYEPVGPNGITAEEAVALYRADARAWLQANPRALDQLRGKDLACWCDLDAPCHADVLIELANGPCATVESGG